MYTYTHGTAEDTAHNTLIAVIHAEFTHSRIHVDVLGTLRDPPFLEWFANGFGKSQ